MCVCLCLCVLVCVRRRERERERECISDDPRQVVLLCAGGREGDGGARWAVCVVKCGKLSASRWPTWSLTGAEVSIQRSAGQGGRRFSVIKSWREAKEPG